MNLFVITAHKSEQLSIAWLEIDTPSGNFVLQEGHAPDIFVLSENQPLTFRLANGKTQTLYARHGIVECSRDTIKLLIDEAS